MAVEQEFDQVAEAELEFSTQEVTPEPVTAMRMRDLLIALMHGPQLSFEVGALAVILIAGFVFTWHRIRHRSVWPAIGCHVTYNATLMAAFLLSWHAAEL